jgi:hypothetical protein
MKKKSIITKFILFNLLLIVVGCQRSAETKLEECSAETKLEECLKVSGFLFEGTHRSGYVYGEAFIELEKDGSFCGVNYSALGHNAVEYGKLTNFELKENHSNNTYEIIADWDTDGGSSNDAKFSFEIIDNERPNTIRCQITGAGLTDDGRPSWVHFSNLTLSPEKFLKIKKILSIDGKDSIVSTKNMESITDKTETKEITPSKSNDKMLVAKYKSFEYVENSFYTFIDDNGQQYVFTDIPETYNLIGESGPNELYVNKKFKIHWITVEGEYDYPINKITKIELIK